MASVCAWCGEPVPLADSEPAAAGVSHGLCHQCNERLKLGLPVPEPDAAIDSES